MAYVRIYPGVLSDPDQNIPSVLTGIGYNIPQVYYTSVYDDR